jgi:exodeoxyribonuclease III
LDINIFAHLFQKCEDSLDLTFGILHSALCLIDVIQNCPVCKEAVKEEIRKFQKAVHRNLKVCGDFNIAHTPLDIKNAKANEKHAGFLPEERAYVDKWLDEYEFVDVMRSLAGDIQGPYTWWSQRGRAFDNNVGWRIDYWLASSSITSHVSNPQIHADVMGSDHCPVSIEVGIDKLA